MSNAKSKSVKKPPTYKKPQRQRFALRVAQEGEENKTDIYQQEYNQQNRDLARSSAHTLMKHPEVQKLIKQHKSALVSEISPQEVASKQAEHIRGEDKKLSMDAIKEYHKVLGLYPDKHNIKFTREYKQVFNELAEE